MRTPLKILRTHLGILRQRGIDMPGPMTSRARPGISKGLLAQLIALVRADEAGSLGDETEMVDLGGIAAAAVAERVPAALAARVDIQFARRKASLPFLALSTRPHSIAVCVGN